MIVAGQRLPILIATKPVDFRCGHQALALIVQTELKLDPHSGVTVVFRSKRGDRLKILVWCRVALKCGIRKSTGVDRTWGSCGAFSVCDGQPTIENCGPCDGYSVSPFGRPTHPPALSHAGIGNVIN